MMAREIIFPHSEGAKQVGNFLKKRYPIGYVRKLFRKHAVRLNGARCGPQVIARPGDRIELFIPFERRPHGSGPASPARSGFEILFEDDGLLVINKPAGLAVHEGKVILRRHSLHGMLEATYRSAGVTPTLVHRIDRETSGLLVVAKRDEVARDLEGQFEEGEVEKEYLALVVGRIHPREGKIKSPLPGRDGGLVPALTLYRVKKEFADTSLVRVRTATGRMHQIRRHFAQLGHSIVMDRQHGDFSFNKQFRKAHGLKRQFLHACSLASEYRGKKRRWSAPLPEDLARTLKALQIS
jgi:23S rRNA pseudouridine955/2504/2580 synthase